MERQMEAQIMLPFEFILIYTRFSKKKMLYFFQLFFFSIYLSIFFLVM